MIGRRRLELNYKGSRNYIQGPDLYDSVSGALIGVYPDNAWVSRIVFRGFSSSACDVVFGAVPEEEKNKVRAHFKIIDGERVRDAVVVETGIPVEGRYEYDEDKICDVGVISNQKITQTKRAGFTAIEEIVALTKKLHNELYPLDKGKWIFAQLDLDSPFGSADEVYSIEIKQSLNKRLTVSEITVNGSRIGKIRFAVANI